MHSENSYLVRSMDNEEKTEGVGSDDIGEQKGLCSLRKLSSFCSC